MKREIITTSDGSKTIFIPEMDENYHSGHGALQEARHVFIKNGLQNLNVAGEINIFEMGFGTGLNALLTMIEAEQIQQKIHYCGIEAFPVELDLIRKIEYETLFEKQFELTFLELHTSEWNKLHTISEFYKFEKILQKIEDFEPESEKFDLIYFDAFGPRAQKEMWSPEILSKMYKILKKGGILVTYCANGQFKRDLKSIGFSVKALPGPPGKREMTRALKSC